MRACVDVSTSEIATTGDRATPAFTPALACESTSRFDFASTETSLAPTTLASLSTCAVTSCVAIDRPSEAPRPKLSAVTVGSALEVFFASSVALIWSAPGSGPTSDPSASVTAPPAATPARTSVVLIVSPSAPATPTPPSAPAPDLASEPNECCLSPLRSRMPASMLMPSPLTAPPPFTSATFDTLARVAATATPTPTEPAFTASPVALVDSSSLTSELIVTVPPEVTDAPLTTVALASVSDSPMAKAAAIETGPSAVLACGLDCELLGFCPALVACELPSPRWPAACWFAFLPLLEPLLAPPASASLSVTAFDALRALRPTSLIALMLRAVLALTLSLVLLSAKARPSAKLPSALASPLALVDTSVSWVAVASSAFDVASATSSVASVTFVVSLVKVSATTGVIATPSLDFTPALASVSTLCVPVACIVNAPMPLADAPVSSDASVRLSIRLSATLAPMPRLLPETPSLVGSALVTT